jgi:hypothetical protein
MIITSSGQMNNSDKSLLLKSKAHKLSLVVLSISEENMNYLIGLLPNNSQLSKSAEITLYFEILFFYLHLIDRIAYNIIGEMDSVIVLMDLTDQIKKELAKQCEPNLIDEFIKEFDSNLFIKQNEYCQYAKLLPNNSMMGKGESFKNTLYWEFGKKISSLLDCENDFSMIWDIINCVSITLKESNIVKLIEELKPVFKR